MRGFAFAAALSAALLATGGWLSAGQPSAGTKAERMRAATEQVAEALFCEIYGKDSQRSEFLASVLKQVPDYAPALWHTGHVRQNNRWVKFDEVPKLAAQDERLETYRKIREKYPETVAGQLALAEWCAKRGLADHQRAHLTRVLDINPNQPQARRLLGYQWVDGAWLSPQEIAQAKIRAREAVEALRQWKPKLEQIRADLEHSKPQRRQAATERLLAITDPTAVLPMEAVLCGHSEEAALLVVQTLDKMAAGDPAVSLARLAVFSPWEAVREAAAEKLRSRDLHSYVPVLLSAMSTPTQSRVELYASPDGRLTYRHTFYREGQDQRQIAVLDKSFQPALEFERDWPKATSLVNDGRSLEAAVARADFREAYQRVQREVAVQTAAREAAVARQNVLSQQFNERLCWVLATGTGVKLPALPEKWWQWWQDYNEVWMGAEKPLKAEYRRDEQVVYGLVSSAFWQSCLAGATPVWTDRGQTPIEQIKVGDRVLSQDPATGELTYRPVLQTTRREPVDLITFQAGDESIQCSGGHVFWVAGEGWVKARNLKPGTRLHGVTGTAAVNSVAQEGHAKVYNVVVADTHTYFVGKAKILSHDITIRRPTDAVVPGLACR